MNRYAVILFCLAILLPVCGCRQPVGRQNPQSSLFDFSRPGVFGGGFAGGGGGDSLYSPRSASRGNDGLDGLGDLNIQTGSPQEYRAYSQMADQVSQMNRRVGAFDQDNQQLHTEVASLKQKLQLANDYNFQLKQQLSDTSGQINQFQQERSASQRRLADRELELQRMAQDIQSRGAQNQFASNSSSNGGSGNSGFNDYRGQAVPARQASATIRANNSLMSRLNDIRIPGGQARMDGDLIRIEFPSDQLFVPGTYDIQPAQMPLLQNLTATIRQNFPRQIVGVEAHWDNTPLQPATTTHHQLTATQALSVFNNMIRLGLSPKQLFTMGMGSNRPRHAAGATGNPNRRVEIVIYPETYDGD